MGGTLPSGNLLLPFLVAVACVVAMIIALGFELGVLYDYRLRDFKAVTDDTAFAYNGSQCLGYASADKIKTYYGTPSTPEHFECGTDAHKKDLGMLVAASVHGLYHKKADYPEAFKAARHAVGAGSSLAKTTCDQAVTAVTGVAGLSPPLNRMTCEDIYTALTYTSCFDAWLALNAGEPALAEAAGLAAGKEAAGVAAAVAAATAAGEAADIVAQIVSSATTDTTAFDPPGTGDYTSDYTTAANGVTTYDAGNADQKAAYDAYLASASATNCPATVDDLNIDTVDGYETIIDASLASDGDSDVTVPDTTAAETTAGIAAAESAVAANAGGTVGDAGVGDAEIAGLTTPITNLPTAEAADTELGISTVAAAYTAAAAAAAAAASAAALVNYEAMWDYNLYLQCGLVGGLGNVAPVTTLDSLSPVPTASRGGTLGVPLYRYDSSDKCEGQLKPAITLPPAPYADLNCTKPRQARAKVMYGLRLGWSLYATVPCLILIIYLGIDAGMAALCFWSRRMALADQERKVAGGDNTTPIPGVPTALTTLAIMRSQRLGLAIVGFLIVLILKALYDWAPWSTGTILPQARGCASDGTGWDTEQPATTLHFLVIILILAVIIALPLSQLSVLSEVIGGINKRGAATIAVNDDDYYNVNQETSRLFYWFVIVTLGGIVMVGLEAADGTTFGIAWAQRQLEVASTADLTLLPVDEAATLVENAATSAVLTSVTAGATIALVYARWLFSSYGKTNLILWFVWGACVVAAFIPVFIAWGFKLNLDPDSQDVISRCNQLNVDSFEKGLCEYRQLIFSIALVAMLGVFAVMWCCWFKSAAPAAMETDEKGTPQNVDVNKPNVKVDGGKTVAPFQSEKIPLLSLRVRA